MLSAPLDVIYRRININSINFVHLGRLLKNSNAAINDIKLDGSNLLLRNNFSQFSERKLRCLGIEFKFDSSRYDSNLIKASRTAIRFSLSPASSCKNGDKFARSRLGTGPKTNRLPSASTYSRARKNELTNDLSSRRARSHSLLVSWSGDRR